jgi:hypothetical protein
MVVEGYRMEGVNPRVEEDQEVMMVEGWMGGDGMVV